ncbi:MAG: SCP2 sterol-binding domain-containing protein [Thermoplasmata archaeon]|nr:SCP2 sterol-binding domain-containing protein [Thermoplasmata archaeon]
MARFPSAAWAAEFRTAVNANAEYAEAAKAWEGDVVLRVVPPEASGIPPGIHLDLFHGECRAAEFLPEAAYPSSEFVFDATLGTWREILERRLDPVKAVLAGRVKVRGNLAKAMRFTKATGLLIETGATIPSEF